ncbi:MAG: class I SAM-dependent methyltransferase, partial [Chitinophagaceae bacterium]|nr:class I SAM-dependent methyltransferase [Anaerolineae bacterium]
MSVDQSWETIYKKAECVWGIKPDPLLSDQSLLPSQGKVLDLGMGEGRNALFLAMNGYDVTGVDIAPSAVEKCLERAKSMGVTLVAKVSNLMDIEIEPNNYTLIISTMTLQFLKKSEADTVITRIKQGLQPGGMVYLSMFSTEDPSYKRAKETLPELEQNTFYQERLASYMHFFEKQEILDHFADLELIRFNQEISLDTGHPG